MSRVVTEAQIEAMTAMRRAGRSYEWISRRLGLKCQAVRYQCWRLDVHPPAPVRRQGARPPVTFRGGAPVRLFTPAEDARLLSLAAQGLNFTQIGRQIGRNHNVVARRLIILRRRAAAMAEAA